MKNKNLLRAASGALLICSLPAWADDLLAQRMQACATISDGKERLSCYDRLVQPGTAEATAYDAHADAPVLPDAQKIALQEITGNEKAGASALSRHWELAASDKRGIFKFRPHYDNYIIGTYNPSPNADPYIPFRRVAPSAGELSKSELAFQLGFKLKLMESPMNLPLDLWFAYTQRSFWQAQNSKASSPFRESNYQPELMAVIPLDVSLPGLKLRFLNLGIAHQSNGQASSLSRSWNRVYAQAGFERGDFTLVARAWKRINEANAEDDNPRITDYMGHGDIVGTYRWNGNDLSLLARHNFSTDKGAAQLSWAFPLVSNLKGYVQYFSGYGYSLIDYDAYQRVFGIGMLVEF